MTFPKDSITTVVFDANFTLWDPDFYATCELVASHLGVRHSYLHMFSNKLLKTLYAMIPAIGCNVVTPDLLIKHLDLGMHEMLLIADVSATDIIHSLSNPDFARCKVKPDALSTIMYLWMNNYKLILKSDWWSEVQVVQLRKFSLYPFFESVHDPIWSYFKPYAEGAKFLDNNNPENYLMVGNSIESDIQFAKNSGMYSAWLNPDCIPNTSKIEPDVTISNLSELKKIL